MVFAFCFFLAQSIVVGGGVTCTDNGDGTWTCRGSGYQFPTNEMGQATCTNCVAMSPSECQNFKSSVLSYCDTIDYDLSNLSTDIGNVFDLCITNSSKYYSFTDWPYSAIPDTTSNSWADSLLPELTGSSQNSSTNWLQAVLNLVSLFNSSPQVLSGVLPPSPSLSGSVNKSIFIRHALSVYGFWHASYLVAQQAMVDFNQVSYAVEPLKYTVQSISNDTDYVRSEVNRVTCSTCVLGSGDGDSSGGGSGSNVGCLECYLVFLRRFQASLETIEDKVSSIKSTVDNIDRTVASGFSDLVSGVGTLTNIATRIDDYLHSDQSNMLYTVQQAVVVISNNVDSIQRYFFNTFSNASDIASGSYDSRQLTMEEVFNSIFLPKDQGGFQLSEYEKYDWFRRIELQLSQISGIFSDESIDDGVSDSELDSMKDSADGFQDLSSSASSTGESIVSVGSSLRSAAHSIGNIFPSSAPPGEITLLASQYWIGDTDLVLRTDFQIVSFCRSLFGLIWVTLACVALWLLLSSFWVVFFDIARWFCNWFPKIFGN